MRSSISHSVLSARPARSRGDELRFSQILVRRPPPPCTAPCALRCAHSLDLCCLLLQTRKFATLMQHTHLMSRSLQHHNGTHHARFMTRGLNDIHRRTLSADYPEVRLAVLAASLHTPISAVCEPVGDAPCPHEVWMALSLDDAGWVSFRKFTLRISWPASVSRPQFIMSFRNHKPRAVSCGFLHSDILTCRAQHASGPQEYCPSH